MPKKLATTKKTTTTMPPPPPVVAEAQFTEDDDALIESYAALCAESNLHDVFDVYIWQHAVKQHDFLQGRFTGQEILDRYQMLSSKRKPAASSKAAPAHKAKEDDDAGELVDQNKRYSSEQSNLCVCRAARARACADAHRAASGSFTWSTKASRARRFGTRPRRNSSFQVSRATRTRQR